MWLIRLFPQCVVFRYTYTFVIFSAMVKLYNNASLKKCIPVDFERSNAPWHLQSRRRAYQLILKQTPPQSNFDIASFVSPLVNICSQKIFQHETCAVNLMILTYWHAMCVSIFTLDYPPPPPTATILNQFC